MAAAASRHVSNNRPDMAETPAQVLIKVGKNEFNFTLTVAQANELIKQLL
jgi:hypothetical protein